MANFSDLPKEVLEDIMLRLPIETLKQFKVVQKSLYPQINSLMNDPVFLAKHLRNMEDKRSSAQSCRFSRLFMVRKKKELEYPVEEAQVKKEDGDIFGRCSLIMANDDHSACDCIPCDTDQLRRLKFYQDYRYYNVESQCDGIICLSAKVYGTVCLLNPAFREMKVIHCPSSGNNNYKVRAVGFGYDARANEYKVVAITYHVRGSSKAKVYSLRTNSWRKIKRGIHMYMYHHAKGVVYCNGVSYWYIDSSDLRILSFDFSDEVFRDVPFPVEMERLEDSSGTELRVWKESVVLFVYRAKDPVVMDMWVLDSHSGGVVGSYSWTKHLTIGPLEGIRGSLGFWNDTKLLLEAVNGEIKMYDLGSEVVSHVSKRLDWFDADRFTIYRKSWVSVLRKEGKTNGWTREILIQAWRSDKLRVLGFVLLIFFCWYIVSI